MRVLFLTTAYPKPDRPVGGTFVREHARAAALHADVRVVHLDRAAPPSGVFAVLGADDDPPLLRVPYRGVPSPFSYGSFVAGALAAYRRLRADGFEPDVVHAHSFLSAFAGLAVAGIHRKPLVYTEHWSIFLPDDPGRLSPGMMRLARLALTRADVVLPVSDALAAALRGVAPGARIEVMRNAVDETVFHPGGKPEPGRLLTVGLQYDAKALDVMLRAVRVLADRGRDARLDLVGDGPLRGELETLSARLDLDERVRFLGLRTKPQVAEHMRGAQLFVLSSRFENNPCVVLESLCCGLPVVATRVGGVPELVSAENGVLVEPGAPAAFADGIEAALDSPSRFDRPVVATAARSRYGRAAVGARLGEVYAEVARPR